MKGEVDTREGVRIVDNGGEGRKVQWKEINGKLYSETDGNSTRHTFHDGGTG